MVPASPANGSDDRSHPEDPALLPPRRIDHRRAGAERNKSIHAMKKLRIKIGAAWRWMRCFVLRSSEWESGALGGLEARRSKNDGRVEIFAPKSNPEQSLWLETHKDHWENFEQNASVEARP
jgi:hypothetical protein